MPVRYRRWFVEKYVSEIKKVEEINSQSNPNEGLDFKSLAKFEKKISGK